MVFACNGGDIILNLEELREWVAKGSRYAKVEINNYGYTKNKPDIKAYVFDYDILSGQDINDVSEIDIEKTMLAREKELYQELMKKYATEKE